MPDLTFTIKTPAELQGAEAAAKALEVNIGKAKALGKDFAALDQKLNQVRTSIDAYKASAEANVPATKKLADESERYQKKLEEMERASHNARAEEAQRLIDLKNTTKRTEENSDKTDKFKFRLGDLKQAVTALSREFPILGLAGRLALNPLVGIAVGLAYVINSAREDYRKFREQLNKPVETKGLTGAINAVTEAMRGAKEESADFFIQLGKIVTAQKSIGTAADEAIGKLNKQAAKLKELETAYKDRQLAELRFQKTTGDITPEQYEQEVADLENVSAGRERKIQEKLEADILNELKARLAEATAQRDALAPQVKPAIEAANKFEAEAKRISGNRTRARENLRNQNEAIAGTQDKPGLQDILNELTVKMGPEDSDHLSRMQSIEEWRKTPNGIAFPLARKFIETNTALQAARQKQLGQASKVRELDAAEEPAKNRAIQARAEAGAMKEKIQELESDVINLESRVKELQSESGEDREIKKRIEGFRRETRSFETKTRIHELQRQRGDDDLAPSERRRGLESDPGIREPARPQAGIDLAPLNQTIEDTMGNAEALVKTMISMIERLDQKLADTNSRMQDTLNV